MSKRIIKWISPVCFVVTADRVILHCQLPTANCQLPTANCQLPTANCQGSGNGLCSPWYGYLADGETALPAGGGQRGAGGGRQAAGCQVRPAAGRGLAVCRWPAAVR